jgi:hypothetical protein
MPFFILFETIRDKTLQKIEGLKETPLFIHSLFNVETQRLLLNFLVFQENNYYNFPIRMNQG